MTPIAIYEQQINHYKTEISLVQRRLSGLGWIRLLFFAGALICGYKYISTGFEASWLVPVVVLLGAFTFVLLRYVAGQDRLAVLKALLDLNEKEWRLAATGQSGVND